MEKTTLGALILNYIRDFPGTTDAELANRFKRSHQTINKTCNGLMKRGLLLRRSNPDKLGYIGNYLPDSPLPELSSAEEHCTMMTEDAIKQVLVDMLEKDGWRVQTAWGHSLGVDIEANRDGKRWLLEVKGSGKSDQARANYFIGVLGETLKRMDDPDARYSIVFPDMEQYRRKWNKLPRLAKDRTTIDMLLVDANGNIEELK